MSARQFSVDSLFCPFCDAGASETATVCRGCQAEIVRGATSQERSLIRRGNFVFGLIAAILIHAIFGLAWSYFFVIPLVMILLGRVDCHRHEIRYFRTFVN